MDDYSTNKKDTILIVDDSEMNRSILADILESDFEILEAENGVEAIKILQKHSIKISLVLLDIVMPEMDGFEVLAMMNRYHWIENIPVVMISAETASSYIERAYELGVTDFISRPFDSSIVYRRVNNTIMLYAKQKKLISMVTDQIFEKEKSSNLMISILSHIVEFRNGESGLHVLHVQTITELLLNHLANTTTKYHLPKSLISLITTAAALHDIGKISIPDEVINKPGRLTDEEFAIMKTHSTIGAEMLKELPYYQDEPLVKIAGEITRWHHERYDGRGYPDGLKGEEIPISAQVVALADVYDALTSERVYKKAFSHEKAMNMILNGECGTFNPLLLQCLKDISNELQDQIKLRSVSYKTNQEMRDIADEINQHAELSASKRTLELLEYERQKYEFFASMSQEILFEYTKDPSTLSLSSYGATKLGIDEIILNPAENQSVIHCFGENNMKELQERLKKATPKNPMIQFNCPILVGEEQRMHSMHIRTIWSFEDAKEYSSFFGKLTDIHTDYLELSNLKTIASKDGLTNLLNQSYAERIIVDKINNHPNLNYALILFDLDNFKDANDTYGHMFGDELLKYVADILNKTVRSNDVIARIVGDEFLICIEYREEEGLQTAIDRIYGALNTNYKDFKIKVSMGIAKTKEVGTSYETLFRCSDLALYTAKYSGKGKFVYYESDMKDVLAESLISSKDSDNEE